jgi:hypothetical protein
VTESWFDLRGGLLRVNAEAELLAPLLIYLAPLRCPPGPACFDLSIAWGVPEEAPAGMTLAFSGELPEGGTAALRLAPGRRRLDVEGRLSAEVDERAAQARMRVAPGCERWTRASAGMLCLDAALRAAGQILAHAAAVIPPGRAEAILLCGPSGRGKTTTTLALALGGFAVLTDDASILGGAERALRVWGLPRPMKLHRNSLALLPALGAVAGPTWNEEDEQGLQIDALRSLIDVRGPEPAPLAGVVWLGERSAGPHLLRPAGRADLLAWLAADNVQRAPQGVAEDSIARFNALARAVMACRVYELQVGADLPSLAEMLARAF